MTSPDPSGSTPPGDTFDLRHYDQICFACGDRNPHGLHMRFERDPDGPDGAVLCRYEPREADQGFPGVLHGGILSALMDEAMAWAMWEKSRALGVTAKMETRYRRPAEAGASLTVHAVVTEERGRRIQVEAAIAGADSSILVESSALFLRLSPEEEVRVARALGWADIPR
ncbi:MAG: PaaI family thioesterase [Dehalococcoidia bacterium]